VRDKRDLVRVVHTPDDRYVLDTTGKAAGRGAYVCPSAECIAQAVKRKSFDRAFRQSVPRDAVAALEASIQDYLSARTGETTEGEERRAEGARR
jgi:uncharacterized protein